MAETSTSLQKLVKAMGDCADYLQHTPYESVITEPLYDEDEAINIKILLGYAKMSDTTPANATEIVLTQRIEDDNMPDTGHMVWIHLYPPHTANTHPEIHFHEYTSDGLHVARLDGENITRVLCKMAKAFISPTTRKWSKSKLVALAKYYFLRKLDETDGTSTENQILRMPISKTFRDDLTAACRDLKEAEEAKKVIDPEKKGTKRRIDSLFVGEDESELSDEDDVNVKSRMSSLTISDIPFRNIESQQDTIQSLLELSRNESRIIRDAEAIEQDILALKAKRAALLEQRSDIQKGRADMLVGLSAAAAFTFGCQVEREMANKRRRLH